MAFMKRTAAGVYAGVTKPSSIFPPPIDRPVALPGIALELAISERFKELDETGARARIS
jgi:hypothetical protein